MDKQLPLLGMFGEAISGLDQAMVADTSGPNAYHVALACILLLEGFLEGFLSGVHTYPGLRV